MAGQGQTLTFDSIKQQYPLDKFILLLPQVSRNLLNTVPMWSLDVATVKVDPADKSQAYEIGWKSGEYGLTKVSLDSIATAADLTVLAERVDNRQNRMIAEYKGIAIMTTPSGGTRAQGRTCEWDGEVAKQKKQREAEQWFARMTDKDKKVEVPGHGWRTAKSLDAERQAATIKYHFEGEWIREQEFGKRMVESKAGNRAVRALLGIQPKYGFAELRDKEFAIVRFVFTPDLSDRETRLMVIGAGLQAQRMLYSAAPNDQITAPTMLPAPAVDDYQEAEPAAGQEIKEPGPVQDGDEGFQPPPAADQGGKISLKSWPDAVEWIEPIRAALQDWSDGNPTMIHEISKTLDMAEAGQDTSSIEYTVNFLKGREVLK